MSLFQGFGYAKRVIGLCEWQEVLGVLQGVDRGSGVLSFRGLLVAVPPRELETLPDIETYIGERVGLLRTNIPHRPLCLRRDEPTSTETRSENLEQSTSSRVSAGSTQGEVQP